ncbi:MAG: hypothetical protein IJX77_08105 [Ruminococcus sp.]|nr:hypothetical protein [Ruminococcus sp.]
MKISTVFLAYNIFGMNRAKNVKPEADNKEKELLHRLQPVQQLNII